MSEYNKNETGVVLNTSRTGLQQARDVKSRIQRSIKIEKTVLQLVKKVKELEQEINKLKGNI